MFNVDLSNQSDKVSSENNESQRANAQLESIEQHESTHLEQTQTSNETAENVPKKRGRKRKLVDGKERDFKCEHCEKKFHDTVQLTNHRNIHLGLKPYECTECKQAFTTRGELTRHTRYKHTFERGHKCTECDYSSVELSKLKRHMRVHTDERPYLCGFCDYASRDTFKLKRHMRIHTGEKPYECPVCKQCFTQSNSLKTHLKVHNKLNKDTVIQSEASAKRFKKNETNIQMEKDESVLPGGQNEVKKLSALIIEPAQKPVREDDQLWFSCKDCFMRFLTQELLDEHTAKHTGERPFTCEICGIRFSHKFAMKQHIQSHDPSHMEKVKQTILNTHKYLRTGKNKANANVNSTQIDQNSNEKNIEEAIKSKAETLSSVMSSISPPVNF